MAGAGGLRTRRRAAGRETILQQSKIDSRGIGNAGYLPCRENPV